MAREKISELEAILAALNSASAPYVYSTDVLVRQMASYLKKASPDDKNYKLIAGEFARYFKESTYYNPELASKWKDFLRKKNCYEVTEHL